MATLISVANLTGANASGAATSLVSSSITPQASGTVLIVVVVSVLLGSTPAVPTITGLGLTWAQVGTVTMTSTNTFRLTVFRATGSPTSGTITADFSGVSQNAIGMIVDEISNAPITNNGADAIGQVKTNSNTSTSTLTITFDTQFTNILHGTYAAFIDTNNDSLSPYPTSSSTILKQQAYPSSQGWMLTEYNTTAYRTPGSQKSLFGSIEGIGLELIAISTDGGFTARSDLPGKGASYQGAQSNTPSTVGVGAHTYGFPG